MRQMKKTDGAAPNGWHQIVVETVGSIHWLSLLLVGIYAGSCLLTLPDRITANIHQLFFIALLLQIARMESRGIKSFIRHYREVKVEHNAAAVTMTGSISILMRLLLWSILILLALDNFGINITALVAGLGVGKAASVWMALNPESCLLSIAKRITPLKSRHVCWGQT